MTMGYSSVQESERPREIYRARSAKLRRVKDVKNVSCIAARAPRGRSLASSSWEPSSLRKASISISLSLACLFSLFSHLSIFSLLLGDGLVPQRRRLSAKFRRMPKEKRVVSFLLFYSSILYTGVVSLSLSLSLALSLSLSFVFPSKFAHRRCARALACVLMCARGRDSGESLYINPLASARSRSMW